MKIAIVKKEIHTECVGFLCELLKAHELSVYSEIDTFSYLDYFARLYPFERFPLDQFRSENYDLTVKLTSPDPIQLHPESRVIGILHAGGLVGDMTRFITLSPTLKTDRGDSIHILPIYKSTAFGNRQAPILKNADTAKVPSIVYIGLFPVSSLDEDLDHFIQNADFHFNFIIWGHASVAERLSEYENVTLYTDLSTPELMNLIAACKFVLCRKYPYQNRHQFSGAIALALSHCKPMILQAELQQDYGIPSINFEKNYRDLAPVLNTMSQGTYNKLVQEIRQFCLQRLAEDTIRLDAFLIDAFRISPKIHHIRSHRDRNLDSCEVSSSWKQLSPDYSNETTDLRQGRAFIQQHFDAGVLSAFDRISDRWEKDLLSYCKLFIEGGVVADLDLVLLQPLKEIVADFDFVCVVDSGNSGDGFFDGFLAARPGNKLMNSLIHEVVIEAHSDEKGPSGLSVSGPQLFRMKLNEMLYRNPATAISPGDYEIKSHLLIAKFRVLEFRRPYVFFNEIAIGALGHSLLSEE